MSDHHTTETAAVLPVLQTDLATVWLTLVYPSPAAPIALTGRTVVGRSPGKGVRCDDRRMSRKHFAVHRPRKDGPWRLEDAGTKNGTRVNGARVETAWLTDGSVIRAGDSIFVFEMRTAPGSFVQPTPAGRSLALDWAQQMIDRVAPTELTVLVQGPTGAGKERLAQRLHAASGRSGAFVPVNCTTLPQTLVASELFGHVKGAFSGADARQGLFAAADGGTLFLDEVGDLPIAQQPMLLRALQERRIRSVGSEVERAVDVRVVAATHCDLAGAVSTGAFRADLLARLTELDVMLPGLHARRVDILPIFQAMAGAALAPDAAEAVLIASWPTNIRGLQRLARRIKLFADAVERIELSALPSALQAGLQIELAAGPRAVPQAEIEAQLTAHAGNVSRAARALGLTRQALYRRLQALDLDASRFR